MSEASRAMDIVREMEATGSRGEKERLLRDLLQIDLGKWAVQMAYDPFITFGLTPARQPLAETMTMELRKELVEPLFKELAERKLTGDAARREVAETMNTFEPDGAELLFRVLSKDLKCGIGKATIQQVMPGLVPVFSVMRAHKFEEKRVKTWPQFVEPKYDGFRYTFLCRDGNGGFFSRSGIRQPSCDHLVEPMIQIALFAAQYPQLQETLLADIGDLIARENLNFMADGEMIAGAFNKTSGDLRRAGEATDAVFHMFDIMSYADFDAIGSVGKPYEERRKLVEEFVSHAGEYPVTKTERYFANSMDEIHGLFEKFRARGLEGAMVKNPKGLYDKKKTFGWMKIKPEETEDLPIVGAYPGESGTKYEHCLGGVSVRRVNGVVVDVGGGFSDAEREELWKLYLEDIEILGDPDKDDVFTDAQIDSLGGGMLLGRLIEVEFHEETPDGSLRHPRYKRFRDDKAGEIESKEAA